jgi:hypothetical protein
MEYQDLYCFPEGHFASPYPHHKPLVEKGGEWAYADLPAGLVLVAVGWIEGQEFARGEMTAKRLQAIRDIVKSEPLSDGTLGVHSCSLCGKSRHGKITAHGHYLYRLGSRVHMFPRFILHYIVSHQYLPPDELFESIEQGVRLTAHELKLTRVEDHLRRQLPAIEDH